MAGFIEVDGDYDGVLISDISTGTGTLAEVAGSGGRFVECAITGLTFDGGTLRKSRMSDVWLGETRLVAVDLAESSLVDTWLSGCVLAGVQAFSALLRRVSFRNCKLDSVNFRDASLTDVTFEDCVLRDVDFAGARLTRVRFPGCTLSGAAFTKATCSSVDLRGASLGVTAGFDALRGATIDSMQLMALAPLLAHHLGISVADG
ncbi:MAG TPA: pentapeptide repeat-containing protein [Trebonia sp.]|nr:pentapeptide repeat-containing protein [Trebonia sp.]